MLLMIDNYDSFVYNLARYFRELNEEVLIYRNDKITLEDIKKFRCDGIIISPGPKNPKGAGISLEVIKEFKGKIPILGVCLGHQCIGYSFGGKIVKGKRPFHGKVSLIHHNGEGLFENIKNPLKVTRYHSLIVERESLNNELIVTAETDDNVIMALQHKDYPIYGLQFHPEAELTEEGHEILNNFIKICKRFKKNEL